VRGRAEAARRPLSLETPTGENLVLEDAIDLFWEQPFAFAAFVHARYREYFTDILAGRLAAFDIHPSGPLWGRGELRSRDTAAEVELAAMAGEEGEALRLGLEAAGLNQERRGLRLRPTGLAWRWLDAGALELTFALPPGAYATVVLAELGDIRSGGPLPVDRAG